jgi:hypothetical protein
MTQRVLFIEPTEETHFLVGPEGLVWTQPAIGEPVIIAANTEEDRRVAIDFIRGLLGLGLVPYGIPTNQRQRVAVFGGDVDRDCAWVHHADAPAPTGDSGDELPTRPALIITGSGKRRTQMLRDAAINVVQSSGVDVTERVDILPLAKILAEQQDCTVKTAKLRIAEAVRSLRHPDWQPPERGGSRPGAGRPPH